MFINDSTLKSVREVQYKEPGRTVVRQVMLLGELVSIPRMVACYAFNSARFRIVLTVQRRCEPNSCRGLSVCQSS